MARALKYLVGVLILANVALFLVGRYYLHPARDATASDRPPINAGLIAPLARDAPPPQNLPDEPEAP
jgi:hypothetical protein